MSELDKKETQEITSTPANPRAAMVSMQGCSGRHERVRPQVVTGALICR